MKKHFLPLLLVTTLILTGCAQAAANFVPLPDTERLAVTALVVVALGFVFTKIVERLPWTAPFVDKYKEEISLAVAAAVVGFIENALPSAYPEISILVVQLVLAVLAGAGLFSVLGKSGVKGFRS